jgi:hypothetical protein
MTAEQKKGKYVYYHCTGFEGRCGNTYIREERLADLLGDVVKPIHITEEIADDIADALRATDTDAEQQRGESLRQVEQRRRTVVSKIDRGYEDFVSDRISEVSWTRKSAEWEAELQTVVTERARLQQPRPPATATADKILELAKQAEFLYKRQDPAQQRRLLETVLSNCTFDCGTLCPTYSKPFDLLVRGNETGEWRRGWDSNIRRVLKTKNLREIRFLCFRSIRRSASVRVRFAYAKANRNTCSQRRDPLSHSAGVDHLRACNKTATGTSAVQFVEPVAPRAQRDPRGVLGG